MEQGNEMALLSEDFDSVNSEQKELPSNYSNVSQAVKYYFNWLDGVQPSKYEGYHKLKWRK